MSNRDSPLAARLEALFTELGRIGVPYCLRCGGESALSAGNVDLLVSPDRLAAFTATVERLGFLRLPAWGHSPHRYYLTYDPSADRWIELDVVTEIAFGQPFRTLRTDLASRCLSGRRLGDSAFVPAPEDEFLLLLLHCLLNRRGFPQPYRGRLLELGRLIDAWGPTRPSSFAAQLALTFPARFSCSRLIAMLMAGEWGDLLKLGPAVVAKLDRGQRLDRAIRSLVTRARRGLDRLQARPGLTVALLGPEEIAAALVAAVAEQSRLPVRRLSLSAGLTTTGIGWPRGCLLPRAGSTPDLVIYLDTRSDRRQAGDDLAWLHRQNGGRFASALRGIVVLNATEPAELRRRFSELIWRCLLERVRRGPRGSDSALGTQHTALTSEVD